MTTEVLSKFIFADPPHTALNKFELETIVAQRQAFNVLQTASLKIDLEWCSNSDLLAVDKVDLTTVYVLYEFIGDVYQHLNELKCRVIGPLVVIQSSTYGLKFPMRNCPIWSQNLYDKRIKCINFSIDEEIEIRDMIIKLGGIYKRSLSDSTSIILVDVFNPNEQWFKDTAGKQFLILRREWLDEVYNATFRLEWDSQKFFDSEFLMQYQISTPTSLEISSIWEVNSAVTPRPPAISLISQRLTDSWGNSIARRSTNLSHTPARLSLSRIFSPIQMTSVTSGHFTGGTYIADENLFVPVQSIGTAREAPPVVLSNFVFLETPQRALNKFELEMFVMQKQAFNILQTASLEPIWCSYEDLLSVHRVDLTQIYVLYEFAGEAYQHLSQLKCRVIGPLVVLQSFMYSLKFPMRNCSTWAQSLHGKIVTGINFSIDEDKEICDKIIKLGGIYKRSISDSTSIILVDVFNSNEQWFKNATRKQMMILRKEWLNEVYNSASNLERDSQKFFTDEFLSQYAIPVPTDLTMTIQHDANLALFSTMPSPLIPVDSHNLASIWNNSSAPSASRRTTLQTTSQKRKHNITNQASLQPLLSLNLSPIRPKQKKKSVLNFS